jgi:hypothetical protein
MASREENTAYRVFDLLSDVRLNPQMIGFYLAHTPDPNIYDILIEVIEATENTMEEREKRIREMITGK